MANKRIKDLSEKSALASGDYLAIDNDNGTKKVNASGVLSSISSASSAASSASTAASRAQNWIRSTSNFPTGDAYSTTSSYKVGDLVIYSNTLYRCKTACSAGSWSTNSSNFEQTTLAGAITDVNEALSHVGMIIHSTTLNTEAKVKAIYGSNTSWIQHSGYVLRGATSGVVANSATKTGGDDNAYLIKHTHAAVMNSMSSYQGYFTMTGAQNNGNPNSGFANTSQAGTVDNGTNRNIPNYKSVYIWERTA